MCQQFTALHPSSGGTVTQASLYPRRQYYSTEMPSIHAVDVYDYLAENGPMKSNKVLKY
jgi:hypothetical protein